jgi:hypothetical protein
MAKCKNCGKSYSLLTTDLGSGLCRKCKAVAGDADKRTPFDLLEKEFVFLVSRVFFWILCSAANLALIAAVIVLLVNLVPAVREKVAVPQRPAELSLGQADIERALAPASTPKETSSETGLAKPAASPTRPAGASKPAAPTDTIDPALRAKIDALKALFPPDKFAWESVYGMRAETDFWGRVISREPYLVKRGLEYTLGRVLSLYEGTSARVRVVEEATTIISKFAVDKRGEPFEAWASLRRDREMDRQREIRVLESKYAAKRAAAEERFAVEQEKKARGARDALKFAGAAFAGLAVIGLFLCFLAIERNTRMLQAMIERGSTK